MKTKTLALLLLALFLVSSLEAVWADKDFEESELEDFHDMEEDEFDILSEHSCKGKKVKSHNHANGRCLTSECKEICKKDGFKYGKCTASETNDKVKKCYCVKSCHKQHKKDSPCKPDNPPSSAPAFPPAYIVPSSIIPGFSPADSPSSSDAPYSPILGFPVVPPTKNYASLEDHDAEDIY